MPADIRLKGVHGRVRRQIYRHATIRCPGSATSSEPEAFLASIEYQQRFGF